MVERTTPMEKRYDKLGAKVVDALKKRHFDAYYCPTAADAVKQVLDLIPENDVVAWGGSMTMQQTGILDAVKAKYQVIDRDTASNREEAEKLMRQALLSDTFLMSSNAITEDGQLYNIDGTGNRCAALVFGPKSVIVVAGMNKVVKTVADAESRARNIAAPMNAQRFDVATPCNANGACGDCVSPGCICASMVRTRISKPAGKIKVVLIGENYGM